MVTRGLRTANTPGASRRTPKEEEMELYRRMGNGPVAFTRPTSVATPPPPPQQSVATPQAKPRQRRAPRKDHGTP